MADTKYDTSTGEMMVVDDQGCRIGKATKNLSGCYPTIYGHVSEKYDPETGNTYIRDERGNNVGIAKRYRIR